MALVLEDGTGIASANSYADTHQAMAFHALRGTWQQWNAVAEADADDGLLISASRWIDARYTWRGSILLATQGMALPRGLITLADGRELDGEAQVALAAEAVSLLALRGWQTQAQLTDGRVVLSESMPDWSRTYQAMAQVEALDVPDVDAILAPLRRGEGVGRFRMSTVVRWS